MSAGGAVIGALRVVLGADTADFDKGLKQSQSGLAAFGKQVAAIAGGISLEKGLDKAITALFGAVKSGIEEADKLNKLSQSIGIPVDELSKLKYAGDLADVSLESLGKSTVKLSKAMIEVAGGGTGPAKQAFDALGISVKNSDGTMKSANEVLGEAADKFSGYKDGAAKTALAVALFGKAGAEMIPLLNMGKDGLQEAGEEAEKFGIVLDKNTTQAAENFNDNLTRLHKTKDGVVVQITARLLPALEDFSAKMVQASKDASLLDKVASGIEEIFKRVASITVQVTFTFQRLFAELGAFVKAYQGSNGVFSGLAAGWEAMNKEGEASVKMMWDLKATVAKIWDKPVAPQFDWSNVTNGIPMPKFDWEGQLSGIAAMNKEVAQYGKEWAQAAAPVMAADTAAKNALQTFLASQAKRVASQNAEAESIGKATGELERLRVTKQADEILDQNKIARTPAVVASIAAAGNAAATAAMKIQAAQLVQETMNPAEKYAQQMLAVQQLYDAQLISLDTLGKKQQQIAEQAGATWDIAGASIAGSFAQISGAFGKESSAMATAAKVFGVIQGTISMFTGAAKALELPFPANIAAVAAVLAKGASLVASIKSQTIPTGYATGGFVSGAGTGTSDSIPAMLSDGEFVMNAAATSQHRAELEAMNSGRSGGGRTTIIRLITDELARPFIEKLIPALNEALRDGHQIKLQTA